MGIWRSYQLRIQRKRWRFRALRKRHELSAVNDRMSQIKKSDILLFSTFRNEGVRFPYFLKYYRDLVVWTMRVPTTYCAISRRDRFVNGCAPIRGIVVSRFCATLWRARTRPFVIIFCKRVKGVFVRFAQRCARFTTYPSQKKAPSQRLILLTILRPIRQHFCRGLIFLRETFLPKLPFVLMALGRAS